LEFQSTSGATASDANPSILLGFWTNNFRAVRQWLSIVRFWTFLLGVFKAGPSFVSSYNEIDGKIREFLKVATRFPVLTGMSYP
jgi:hypothetical protein